MRARVEIQQKQLSKPCILFKNVRVGFHFTSSNLIFVGQFCECKTMINACARRDSAKQRLKPSMLFKNFRVGFHFTCSNLIFVRQFCECKTMIKACARRDSTKTTFKAQHTLQKLQGWVPFYVFEPHIRETIL